MEKVRISGKKFITESGSEVIFNGINFVCKRKEKGYLEPNIYELIEKYSKKDSISFL